MLKTEILVIGAGVLGLCTAVELTRRGHDVRVLDPGERNASSVAAGMIASTVGMTAPTVAPIPTWTSGIAAIQRKTIGSEAAFRSCVSAAGSQGTPSVHAFTGTLFVSRTR